MVLDVDGVRIEASISGDGPAAIVWSHGLLHSRSAEDELGLFDWSALPAEVRIVRYDAPGHGDSQVPSSPDALVWSELGKTMVGVAAAGGAETFVAGGASMGCATALHAATVAPERVAGLVLMIPPTAWETRAAQAQLYRTGAKLFIEQPDRALGLFVAALGTVPPLGEMMAAEYPEAVDIMKRHIRGLDPATVPVVLEGAARSDFPDPATVAAIHRPALVLAWEGDTGHPLSTAERLHDLLPNSELHVARSLADVRTWPSAVGAFLAELLPG
jgi:3-oxoadipate enol-lactonase